jgi:bifunctional DNA-binding transcriptional regulator/antitoxin component of YhaV-PrlF toxin-antitoxin module
MLRLFPVSRVVQSRCSVLGPDLNGVTNDASNPTQTATYCLQTLASLSTSQGKSQSSCGTPALYFSSTKVKAMPKVSSKNQVTIPVEAMRAAGLHAGDEITVRPVGAGEIVIATRGSRVRRNAGIASGIYEDGELDRLRDEWKH